jgi:hypothetical protein
MTARQLDGQVALVTGAATGLHALSLLHDVLAGMERGRGCTLDR